MESPCRLTDETSSPGRVPNTVPSGRNGGITHVEATNLVGCQRLDNIEKGKMPGAEAEIAELRKDGHQMLITKNVEREFLHGQGMKPADTVRAQGVMNRLGVSVDTMANQVPMQQLRAWRDAAIRNGLSIPDADVIAQIRASAQARGIRNPIFLTRDAGGTLAAMRRNGVMAVEFKVQVPPPVHKSTPKPAPTPPVVRPRINAAKASLKAGIKGAFSAASIASLIPDVILAIADRAAVRDVIRNIQTKFLKEGFAKGVAAGVMGWIEEEVELNLKNRVTTFRIQGLEDPAGYLKRSDIFKLAEGTENYGVDVGYLFSHAKPLAWKREMHGKGFSVLAKYGYHFGEDPEALFEFEFIDKLAWVLRPTTDSIVGPAIRFGD